MAVTVKKLRIGQLVEVDGRLYDVVPDAERGVTLEPPERGGLEAVRVAGRSAKQVAVRAGYP